MIGAVCGKRMSRVPCHCARVGTLESLSYNTLIKLIPEGFDAKELANRLRLDAVLISAYTDIRNR